MCNLDPNRNRHMLLLTSRGMQHCCSKTLNMITKYTDKIPERGTPYSALQASSPWNIDTCTSADHMHASVRTRQLGLEE